MGETKLFSDLFAGSESTAGFSDVIGGSENYPDIGTILEDSVAESVDDHDERLPGYHPSQISSRECIRFFVLHVLPETHRKKEFSPQTLEIFDVGHDTHSRIQRYLSRHLVGSWKCKACRQIIGQNMAYICRVEDLYREKVISKKTFNEIMEKNHTNSFTEKPIPEPQICPNCELSEGFSYREWKVVTDSGIMGSVDGILALEGFENGGLEIKSVRSYIWASLNKTTDMVKKYSEQFGIYLRHLGLSWGVFIFENKDDQRKKFMFITPDELSEELNRLDSTIAKANEFRAAKRLPKATLKNECKNCEYYKTEYCNPR